MAAFFMPKGTNGEPYDPFSISGADHWHEVGAQKVRALSNDLANATFRPGWLRSVGPGWTTGRWRASWIRRRRMWGKIPWPSRWRC